MKFFLKFCNIFCPLLISTTIIGQQNFSSLGDGLLDGTFKTKNGYEFTAKLKTFFLILPFSVFSDLFINKARKLEVAVSNPIMEDIPVSRSLSVG